MKVVRTVQMHPFQSATVWNPFQMSKWKAPDTQGNSPRKGVRLMKRCKSMTVMCHSQMHSFQCAKVSNLVRIPQSKVSDMNRNNRGKGFSLKDVLLKIIHRGGNLHVRSDLRLAPINQGDFEPKDRETIALFLCFSPPSSPKGRPEGSL
jgi:predicted XRE-type DNA-binding protein